MNTPQKTKMSTCLHEQRLLRDSVFDYWMAGDHCFLCYNYDYNFNLLDAKTCLLEIFSEPEEGTLKLVCEAESARVYPKIAVNGCPVILLDPAKELVLSLNRPVIYWRLSPLPS